MLEKFLKKQFIDVIEWTEGQENLLSYKVPMQDNEIQTGAKLTVRDSQLALFVNEGQIADVFTPGLHTLSTQTLPVLTNLMNWDKAFNAPFKSDVYFFSTREQLDQRWGTQTPITVRDKEFGVVRIRANGVYSYAIEDAKTFYQKVTGTRDSVTVNDLEGQLRAAIMTGLATELGQGDIAFLDMAGNQAKFSEVLHTALTPTLAQYGLKLATFFVQSITLPEELQAHLDKLSSMNMIGDMQRYTQFQAAESLPLAAQNEGGLAGAGAGLGAGLAMGQTMAMAMGTGMAGVGNAGAAAASQEDPYEAINKLHDLLTKGILTQAEFDAKKGELLKKIQ
jgi:membrane protease subunit (stomatin/prohibitin family)